MQYFHLMKKSPSAIGGVIEQSWVYDKNNSTIENIIALPPQQIEYFGYHLKSKWFKFW